MNVKALKKQLMAAIAMVIVAAVALSSSTYAWFAANDTVTANGMSVTAKSDVTFLMIKQGEAEISAIRGAKLTTDAAEKSTAALLPTAHDAISNQTEASTAANWYYKYSTDPAVSGGSGKESDKKTISDSELNKYILVNEFSLGLAEGSNEIQNIKVGDVTLTTAGDSAVKVLVVSGTAAEEFSATGTGSTVLQASLSGDAVMHVWVYIYWDGADEDVYTNGIADLQNTDVTVTFTGTPVVA